MVYSKAVQAMIKNVGGSLCLARSGCAPPILTFSVSYVASSQQTNNIAQTIYGGYQPPYLGQCNMYPGSNGYANPVPTSRRLLASGHTGQRELMAMGTSVCYRRVVTLQSVEVSHSSAVALP